MKKLAFLLYLFCAANILFAQQNLNVSGILDSKLTFSGGPDDNFMFGIEEYANLRLQAKIQKRAVFYGAFNLTAVSGVSALQAMAGQTSGGTLIVGENYAAALELERLYFRLNSDAFDLDAGLMRLAFGFGQSFAPSDFLSTRNPLFPDARPRAVLGTALYAYPSDSAKLQSFMVSAKNPLTLDGAGTFFGFAVENHWNSVSFQALYAFETPYDTLPDGMHRGGFSFKLDVAISLWIDILYNHIERSRMNGLAASAGMDCSFFDGSLYLLVEYLHAGSESIMSINTTPAGFNRSNYLSALLMYRFDDYSSLSLSGIAGIDDWSFLPGLTIEQELFQGFSISLNGRVPLDESLLKDNDNYGEFGPKRMGSHIMITTKARLRF